MIAHATGHALWARLPSHGDPAWWFVIVAGKGTHGVDLFFVLSGFCLAYPFLERLRRDGAATFDTAGFFAKRFVRIVPPFYIAIAVTLIGMLAARRAGLVVPSSMSQATGFLDVLKAMLFLDRNTNLTNGSFWTLFVELRWYLLFPLMLSLYVRSARAFYGVIAACVVAYNFTTLRAIDIAVLPAFMLGIVAADWRIRGNRLEKHALLLAFVAFDVALLLEPFAAIPSRFGLSDEFGAYQQTNIGWQIASFFLIVAAGRFSQLATCFEWAPLRAIGVAAYAIYLVHQPLVNLWTDSIAPAASGLVSFGGALALGLGGGLLFWLCAERPFVTDPLRARWVRALRGPSARALAFVGVPLQFAATAPPAQRELAVVLNSAAARADGPTYDRLRHPGV